MDGDRIEVAVDAALLESLKRQHRRSPQGTPFDQFIGWYIVFLAEPSFVSLTGRLLKKGAAADQIAAVLHTESERQMVLNYDELEELEAKERPVYEAMKRAGHFSEALAIAEGHPAAEEAA